MNHQREDKGQKRDTPNDISSFYEIRLQGHLPAQRWDTWFENMVLSLTDEGETILTGPVTDQAALYGLLRKVRDLGLPLLSVSIKP